MITTSLFSLTIIMVSKGNHPKMALIQVSELLLFTQKYGAVHGFSGESWLGIIAKWVPEIFAAHEAFHKWLMVIHG